MILEIDNVELSFKGKRILNGIYLKAESGKVTGILGSNGCGKSSLMQLIFGSLIPKYKLIRIDDKPVLKPLYKLNYASYLPQYPLIPNNIKLKTIFRVLNIDWETFVSHFDDFFKYENAAINTLSGGEKRIIETYLILMSHRKIILLDEPFSHLAPVYIERFKQLINQEKEHKIIIITDHLHNHITEISDTVYMIKNGYSTKIESLSQLEDFNYLPVR